ncbi:transmembrane protein 131 homolog isoform X2 [Diachasma alloeum]|uniref:transmembrane protein 131 homolog isoform X2 n=1 Tax=Diachasma alloeum TaxID=454923 RepID=UPI00073839DB|nr:transmembrane protein 131 homolog isoform X2 [Diachasma alloeum]
MVETRVCCYLFLLTFLDSVLLIRPSFHGHNNAFVQDDKDVQYLLDNMPMSMHKDFTGSVHMAGDPGMNDKAIPDSISYIQFEPRFLDFKERQLGVPHKETVTLLNRDANRTIHLTSISGSTQHFHSSFFQDKVIPPLGNTSFNVIFLGREEGEIDSQLYIHTSDGTLKYQVKGSSISSPYRLRPVVGVKLPLNASFTPLIYMHNPHSEPMQVVEVYSSGGEFQLELPSGEAEGPRELWEIAPYQTKPVIRLHFNAYVEKNHTAYVRFKVNNSAEIMVVAIEVEVGNGAGLHWGGNSASINLGMGGSLQSPTQYPIALRNSAKKPVKVINVISTPVSKALRINFESTVIPGETEGPVTIGTLIYDWKAGLDLKHFKGKLVIKGIGPGGSSQKLSIPWMADVLQGGLEINRTVAHYCSPHSNQPRNFSVVNRFKVPLAITNVSLSSEAKSLFSIKNFIPRVLKSGQKANIFTLNLNNEGKSDNTKLESIIIIHSNVSTTQVPLLSYDGKVKKIIPGERESDRGTMNFGTVGSGTENEAIFALENQNPVNIELHGWGVNMPGAVLELMGCQSGPTDLFNKGVRNMSVCSNTGNQSIKPGYLAIFKIKVKTPMIEEDTIVGDVFVRTTYERLTVPVYMRVAHGRISLKKLTFSDCFPGSICMQQIKIHSTFSRAMQVTVIAPVDKDNRVKYIPPLEESNRLPTISKGENHIGSIRIDPSVTCKPHCYLGLSLNTTAGNQWLNTMNLPSHTRDSDLNLLNARYSRYLNISTSWDNITMRLDTTEVRGHKFFVNIKPYWPSLVLPSEDKNYNQRNKTILQPLTFPLTQVGNTSFKSLTIRNPSTTKPLFIQLVMDWSYPQGIRLYHSLPNKFKPVCYECPATVDGEFKLNDQQQERMAFQQILDIESAVDSLPLYLNPGESKTIKLSYTPSSATFSSGLLYIRNNMTILEVIRLMGRGAHAQFKFGNRKPSSNTPLLFELAEKHLKDCEQRRETMRKNSLPNLTVIRSFTARNTGELPIDIYGFSISGIACEGYGFKVINCQSFKLNPNSTKKIEIAFTPDFTLSKIERELMIFTSIGYDGPDSDRVENGIVRLSLLTTIPGHILESCAVILSRPTWECPVHWAAIGLSSVFLICILAVSFLEADRILRGALESMSRNSPVQPPLDLRQLATQAVSTLSTKDKIIDDNNRIMMKKKEEPDWMLMNVKRGGGKEPRGLKIPDWSAEEEKRFKIDTDIKDHTNAKSEQTNEINHETIQRKKKKPTDIVSESSQDHQNQEQKINIPMKASPIITNKPHNNNNNNNNNNKKEDKCEDGDSLNAANDTKEKRKFTTQHNNNSHNNNNNNNNNNNINNTGTYKKYEGNTSQKIQYSEEETSSTTTESSTQEDQVPYNKEQIYQKTDKTQRKTPLKKNKQQTSPVANSIDYRDNYEGDCDDDDYDKERQDNSTRWKTNSNKLTTSTKHHHHHHYHHHHHHHQSRTAEGSLSAFKPIKNKNPIRKDKVTQKRRTEKPVKLNNAETKIATRPVPRALSPVPAPPPPACWGENRPRFSDVVTRNQDCMSPAFILNKPVVNKHDTEVNKSPENCQRQPLQEIYKPKLEFHPDLSLQLASEHYSGISDSQDSAFCSESLILANHDEKSSSYFLNSFDPQFEPELVPYDDLPDTDEPLVELECLEDTIPRCQLWSDKNPITNSLSESNNSGYGLPATPKHVDKLTPLVDTFKDNWVTVETNWEPLYTRGAVGEERSGVWGVNTGGVWAAAPWGASTPALCPLQSSSSSSQSPDHDLPERSGFDPFRSLSTIWTPASTSNWPAKNN